MTAKTIEVRRCPWTFDGQTEMLQYHDTEWGVPIYYDRPIF